MPKLTARTVEDDVLYAVELSRPIEVGRSWLRPGEDTQLKGRAIKDHGEAITSIRELP